MSLCQRMKDLGKKMLVVGGLTAILGGSMGCSFFRPSFRPSPFPPPQVVLADVNGDGREDKIEWRDGRLTVSLQSQEGSFSKPEDALVDVELGEKPKVCDKYYDPQTGVSHDPLTGSYYRYGPRLPLSPFMSISVLPCPDDDDAFPDILFAESYVDWFTPPYGLTTYVNEWAKGRGDGKFYYPLARMESGYSSHSCPSGYISDSVKLIKAD